MIDRLPVPSPSLIALAAAITWIVYSCLVHPLFLHPLRHIPSAHWSIPIFGDCWILYQRWRDRNNATTYAAHQKYGEVVRLGYNELSVNCVNHGIKTIYGGGFDKHPWYPQQFASYGVVNMFSTVHHTPHSQKKRTIANVYSKSYLASSPQIAANSKELLMRRFLPLIDSVAVSGESVDMHEVDNAFTMDFMSAYQYGLKSGTNFSQNLAERKHIMHHYHSRRPYSFYSSEIPWFKPLCDSVGIYLIPRSLDQANDILAEWGQNMCQSAEKYMESSTENLGDEPVVYKQFKQTLMSLRAKDPNIGKSAEDFILPTKNKVGVDSVDPEVYSEMLDHLAAGHETSAVALTYLWYELSKHPEMQTRLRSELQSVSPRIRWPLPENVALQAIDLPSAKDIDALPYLNAVILEILRLHAPIPGMQPRVTPVPPSSQGHRLGQYDGIPAGVRVSAMTYTLHRNKTVFLNPEAFAPQRWLDSSAEHLKEMHRWFWAFGSGGRMCIGSHLALQEMKLIVCALISNYEVFIASGGDKDIHEIDAYTVRPTSNQLIAKWKRV